MKENNPKFASGGVINKETNPIDSIFETVMPAISKFIEFRDKAIKLKELRKQYDDLQKDLIDSMSGEINEQIKNLKSK
jgi:hypothetical protein